MEHKHRKEIKLQEDTLSILCNMFEMWMKLLSRWYESYETFKNHHSEAKDYRA